MREAVNESSPTFSRLLCIFTSFYHLLAMVRISAAATVAYALSWTAGVYAQSIAEKVAALRVAPTSNDRVKLLQDKEASHSFLPAFTPGNY